MNDDTVHFPSLPPLPDGDYRTVMADPPWAYDDTLPGGGRGAESHYDVLDEHMVAGMGPQVRAVTDQVAHLYLWTTNSFVPEAYEIAEAWGFEPKTLITWVKASDAPETLPHERDEPATARREFGMGHYARNTTEHMVFATKGNLGTNANDAVTHFLAKSSDHSSKPEKAYRLAEYLSDGPRLELFSRRDRSGWDTWGDEAEDPTTEIAADGGERQ